MDGGFNSITFICSKTDDISLEEAQDSLGLDSEMAPSWEEMDRLVKKQKSIKKHLEEMKETKAVYADAMNDVDEQVSNLLRHIFSSRSVLAILSFGDKRSGDWSVVTVAKGHSFSWSSLSPREYIELISGSVRLRSTTL